MPAKKKLLAILDLDDTLIDTSSTYWMAREEFVKWASIQYNAPQDTIRDQFEEKDFENLTSMGLDPLRYQTSMIDICANYADHSTKTVEKIKLFCKNIQNPQNTIKPFSIKFIKALSEHFVIHILTRGNFNLQLDKLKVNRLLKLINGFTVVEKNTRHILFNIKNIQHKSNTCCCYWGLIFL